MIRPAISAKMIPAFVGKPQRPADAEFLLLRRRDRGENGVVAEIQLA